MASPSGDIKIIVVQPAANIKRFVLGIKHKWWAIGFACTLLLRNLRMLIHTRRT